MIPFCLLDKLSTYRRYAPSMTRISLAYSSSKTPVWLLMTLPIIKWPSDSLKAAVMFPEIAWTVMYFCPRFLVIKPLMASKCYLLTGQLGRDERGATQHSDPSWRITHRIPNSVCPFFFCSPDSFWQQTSPPAVEGFYVFMFSKAVVRAETPQPVLRVSLMFHTGALLSVGVACHRAMISPHRLTTLSREPQTDHCWLTNQQLSTSNLCCGASRLAAFCVTVIEFNRW